MIKDEYNGKIFVKQIGLRSKVYVTKTLTGIRAKKKQKLKKGEYKDNKIELVQLLAYFLNYFMSYGVRTEVNSHCMGTVL